MKEKNLLKDYLNGESNKAFKEIVSHFSPLIYSACIRKQLDEETAKDITQQVFLDFHKKAKSLLNHPNLSGWFYQAALFRALNQINKSIRDQKRMEKLKDISDQKSMEKENWSRVVFPQLDDALKELPEKLSEAIIQHYLVGHSIVESSENLEISEVAMRKRLSRGIKALKEYFSSRGMKVTGALLITILSSPELRAVPKSLASSIIENTSKQIQASSSLTQGIVIMSGSTKISILTVVLILIGSIAIYVFNDANNENSLDLKVNNYESNKDKNKRKSKVGDQARRLKVGSSVKKAVIENNYTGEKLISHLIDCFKKQPTHKEWYQILLECGITVPQDVFFDEVISSYPEPMNGTEQLDDFFSDVLLKFAMSYPEKSALWTVEREFPKGINFLLNGWTELGKQRAKDLVAMLPDSKEKERALKIIAKMPDLNDLEQKLESTKSLPQGAERQRLISETINSMARLDPAKAYDWVVANLEGDEVLGNLSLLAPGLGEKDPLKAKEILSYTNNQHELKMILSNLMKGMVSNGIEETENFINSLDEGYRKEAYQAAAFRLLKTDPFTGIQLFEKYGLEIDERDLSNFITNAARKDFDKTYDYIQKYGNEKNSKTSFVELAYKSSKYFPEKSSSLIKDLVSTYSIKISDPYAETDQQSKEFRERTETAEFNNQKDLYNAVNTVTRELFIKDLKIGYDWLKSINFKDQETFDKTLQSGYMGWKSVNSDNLLYKFQGLPEEFKEHIKRIYDDKN